ncbi:MAG: quinolinate synthase NadA, partial [Dolichospermum sp.]
MFTTTLTQPQSDNLPLDLFTAITDLKTELNAVILAHYYQDPDIQDI